MNQHNSKFHILLIICFLITTSVVEAKYSTNCKGSLPIIEKSIYGKWIEINDTRTTYISFKKDKTFNGIIKQNEKIVWEYAGTWYLERGYLNYVYTYSSLERLKPGTKDYDEILDIACEIIKFKNKSGRNGIYQRENT